MNKLTVYILDKGTYINLFCDGEGTWDCKSTVLYPGYTVLKYKEDAFD